MTGRPEGSGGLSCLYAALDLSPGVLGKSSMALARGIPTAQVHTKIHSNGTRSKTKEQSNSSNAAAVQQKNVRMESAGKPNRRDAKIQGRKMTMQMKASDEHGDAREVLPFLALHQGNPEMHQSP